MKSNRRELISDTSLCKVCYAKQPKMVFASVGRLINAEMLMACHRDMDGDKVAELMELQKKMGVKLGNECGYTIGEAKEKGN